MMKRDYNFIQRKAESGRTLVEVMAVLAIVGILSVAGVWLYSVSNRERQLNDIIHDMNFQVVQIYAGLQQRGDFASADEFNKFLTAYQKPVGRYLLTFQADPDSDEKSAFMTQITRLDGQPIKGEMCRALIFKMSKLKTARDVSFTLKDEEMDDGTKADVTVPLNGKYVDYDAMCG